MDIQDFLCPLSANIYGIEFLSFRIFHHETKQIYFQTPTISNNIVDSNYITVPEIFSNSINHDDDSMRQIEYTLSEDILNASIISSS